MIIIYNMHSLANRTWLAANARPEDTQIDWYDPDAQGEWIAAGNTVQISSFPSVIVESSLGQVMITCPSDRAECERISASEDISGEPKARLI